MMCDFKFLDFTPDEIIKILNGDIQRYRKKRNYHVGVADSYQSKIEELEEKVAKICQRMKKENTDES